MKFPQVVFFAPFLSVFVYLCRSNTYNKTLKNEAVNVKSFSELYVDHYRRSVLFVKSFVRDDMVSEDIVSEALIALWETIRKDQVDCVEALLVKILKNKSLNYLKHLDVRDVVMENMTDIYQRDLDYRISTLEACEPNEIYSNEIVEIVKKTLDTLPMQTRRIFEMSRFEMRSTKDIAQELGLSTKSVEYHLTKTLKLLRVELRSYLPLLYLFLC